ncbi:hypothetical protein TGARI_240525A, partial [Toxoplasma gondii ARI]
MLSLLQQRRTYGCFLPRSKAYNPSRGRAFAKTTVLRLTASKQIDVFGSMPSELSTSENRKIKEIIFAKTIIVVVTDGGLCRAFYLGSGLLALELNPRNPWRSNYHAPTFYAATATGAPSEVTTAVYNHNNDTIVVVYEPNPGGLQCRDSMNVLTEELVLSHPAFFEFDEANGMILAAQQGNVRFFQFWVFICLLERYLENVEAVSKQNHETFTLVFSVYEEEFEGKQSTPHLYRPFSTIYFQKFGYLMDSWRCLSQRDRIFSRQPYSILKTEDAWYFTWTSPYFILLVHRWIHQADVEIPLDHYRSVEFLELLVCQLLLKQERLSLRIINLLDGGTGHKVAQTRDTFAPIGFVFFEVTSSENRSCKAARNNCKCQAPERVYNKKYLNNCHRRFFTIS